MRKVVAAVVVTVLLSLVGCTKSENPLGEGGNASVRLSVAFFQSNPIVGLSQSTLAGDADSLKIDSAIVVFQRIKFESHVDTVVVDTSEHDSDEDEIEHEDELNVTFRGPFVVHVRDTVAIDFASQVLPAGIYDGIKFKIHRLKKGEHHEDSDEHNGHMKSMSDIPYGSSIIVWGSVLKEGVWTPFEFDFNGEFEFKIKGNFVVDQDVSSVNIVLNFNMDQWFVNPEDGSLLDPTDPGHLNRELFSRAIRKAFGSGKGGWDHDHDGHPDD